VVLDLSDASALLSNTGSPTLTQGLVASTADLHLVSQGLGTELLSLSLVDELHKDALVLEHVTLGLQVQRVVQVLVDLDRSAVLGEQLAKNSHAAHPLDLGGETSIGGTLALTGTSVTSLALGGEELACARSGVDNDRLDNDVTILDQLLDTLTRVGVGDLGCLRWVEPNLALTNAGNGGSESEPPPVRVDAVDDCGRLPSCTICLRYLGVPARHET